MNPPSHAEAQRLDTTLHIRRDDHDIAGFADRIAVLVTADEPVVVNLNHTGEHANEITLSVYESDKES